MHEGRRTSVGVQATQHTRVPSWPSALPLLLALGSLRLLRTMLRDVDESLAPVRHLSQIIFFGHLIDEADDHDL
jgi:hypothetical protein